MESQVHANFRTIARTAEQSAKCTSMQKGQGYMPFLKQKENAYNVNKLLQAMYLWQTAVASLIGTYVDT